MEHIAWIDLETTGVDTTQDRIIEICIIKTDLELNEIDRFYSLVNPEGKKSRPDAIDKHGITDESLLDKPTFKDLAGEIKEFITGCAFGGYNIVYFDLPVLVEEFIRAKMLIPYRKVPIIDPYRIILNQEPRDLTSIYKRFTGKDLEDAHSAEADIRASIEIFGKQNEYYDLPKTLQGLDDLNNRDAVVDLSKKFKINEDKEIIFNFGKHKGKTFKDVFEEDVQYIEWIIDGADNFSLETRVIAKKLLKKIRDEKLSDI